MNTKKIIAIASATLAVSSLLFFNSCQTMPKGVIPVKNFNKDKYLGKWYEIARFDFRFEKDMDNTTATYSLNEDGTIKVINRGYNYKKKKWSQAEGKAKFVGLPTTAQLKVSFFGPFYSPYNVIELDEDYKYALIAGKNTKYMWILSREKSIPDDIRKKYIEKAKSLGFNISNLIWVKHDGLN